MNEMIYLKKTENGKLKRTEDIELADFVPVPKKLYIPFDRWKSIKKENQHLKEMCQSDSREKPDNEESDTITIPKKEYNGLQNLMRIHRDERMKQIDKAKADKHGYTFKYSEEKVYNPSRSNQKAYCITKTTPISLNTDLESANYIIRKDLEEYYHYVELSAVDLGHSPCKIKVADFLKADKQRRDPDYNYDFYVDNSDYGRKLKEFLDEQPDPIIFEIRNISSNIGQGVYEISYWATKPI